MKTANTYPTKHPHWIDEDDYSAPRRQRNGISFSTATVIVIAIHVAVIAGVYAYSNYKPKKSTPDIGAVIEKNPGPKSDALARNKWPEPEAEPKVVATPPPTPIVKATPIATSAPAPKAVVKKDPNPTKTKTEVATAKNPPAPRIQAKPDQGAQEELRRQFLAAAGKPQQASPKVREATLPSTPLAAIQPHAASDTELPVKKALPTTIAAQPAPAARPAHPTPTHYTLAPGDNLYMVSRKLGVSYNDLAKANAISDPRQLRVGQTLKVPGGAAM
ncbi:MAG: LysM peptidoglycan-binding domain-containing protein [Verrucomicrobiota bacterium]